MRSGPGLEAVRHRIAQSNDFVRTKCHLVSTLVEKLKQAEAVEQIRLLPTQRLGKQLTYRIESALDELTLLSAAEIDGDAAATMPNDGGAPVTEAAAEAEGATNDLAPEEQQQAA